MKNEKIESYAQTILVGVCVLLAENGINDTIRNHGGIEKFTGIESVSGYNLFELYIITNPAVTTPYTITS